ncbi:MAG: patatin-like phospholipase family protein [Pseudomonadota bacterium]
MRDRSLRLLAGPDALKTLNRDGLQFADIRVIAGASGGPKWLVLAGLDQYLASDVLPALRASVDLVGSSIGVWRHICLAQQEPSKALARFEAAYIEQAYTTTPTPQEVTAKSQQILAMMLGERGIDDVLTHPVLRQSIITVQSRGPTATDTRPILAAGLLMAAAANAGRREWLKTFFSRAIFQDSRSEPAWLVDDGFGTTVTSLERQNLVDAVVASGSIPFVLAGVKDPVGAPPGLYRDGGVIDYHLDLPLSAHDGITLYPHFYSTITPGWFDKRLSTRHASPGNFRRVLLLCPSPAFVATLPGGKIPDRNDFRDLATEDRIAAWRQVTAESRRLADELADLVATGRVAQVVEPLNLRRD